MGARELDPYLYQNSKFKTRTFIQTGFSGPCRKSMDPNSTALYTGSIPRPTHLLGVYGWTETCTQTNKKKWGQILVPYPDAGTRVLWVFGYPFSSTLRLRFIFSTKQKRKKRKKKKGNVWVQVYIFNPINKWSGSARAYTCYCFSLLKGSTQMVLP